ncbi:RsmE family RNA methyltransferase [Leptospira langatensis]|uniref:16S rRNA (uracil(1498)-N(3))-methyltransferase n=2 Tax=Leptospira langatensis TaxID=2484983 RepID=A0A5F1ZYI1_9LEPT|nr:RsmE family RNA methyltransferase [Leptospira langatensis]TGL43836.1 RsmE family RNA methyltransferase [Leptospira langatensis]
MEQGGNIYLPQLELGFSLPEKGKAPVRDKSLKERCETIKGPAFYLDKKGLLLSEYKEDIRRDLSRSENAYGDLSRKDPISSKKGFPESKSESFEVGSTGPVSILLGPEPGWTKREIAFFHEKKIQPVRLSKAVLRSEQAFAFFLAQWEASFPNF